MQDIFEIFIYTPSVLNYMSSFIILLSFLQYHYNIHYFFSTNIHLFIAFRSSITILLNIINKDILIK